MRYAIISDIHANLEASSIVFQQLNKYQIDKILFLGDLVGYNPDPSACIRIFQKQKNIIAIRGNHDKAVAGLVELGYFNYHAREAVLWTQKQLSADEIDFLKNMMPGPLLIDNEILICHGSPLDEDEYLITLQSIKRNLNFILKNYPQVKICFFGHSHISFAYASKDGVINKKKNTSLELKLDQIYLINPGSVGQPRDGNPDAAFGIYDSLKREFVFYRLAYPLNETGLKIIGYGLPVLEAERLKIGR